MDTEDEDDDGDDDLVGEENDEDDVDDGSEGEEWAGFGGSNGDMVEQDVEESALENDHEVQNKRIEGVPASRYIPPHLRNRETQGQSEEQRKLTRQLKGQLNRYARRQVSLYILYAC